MRKRKKKHCAVNLKFEFLTNVKKVERVTNTNTNKNYSIKVNSNWNTRESEIKSNKKILDVNVFPTRPNFCKT